MSENEIGSPKPSGDNQKDKKRSPAGRKLAEWFTLTLSALLILGIAGFLVFHALQANEPYIPVDLRLLHQETQRERNLYILPIEVRNRGRHAIRELKVEITYTSPEGKEESRDLDLSYLGEQSVQKAYLYFEHPPERLQVEAKPIHYLLD